MLSLQVFATVVGFVMEGYLCQKSYLIGTLSFDWIVHCQHILVPL